mgnify:CR=1 FL=1
MLKKKITYFNFFNIIMTSSGLKRLGELFSIFCRKVLNINEYLIIRNVNEAKNYNLAIQVKNLPY